MCPPPDVPNGAGTDEMVAIDTTQPSLPPPQQTGASNVATQANGATNGGYDGANGNHSHPPEVKTHKGPYGRASDFLSNTSNWKVSHPEVPRLPRWGPKSLLPRNDLLLTFPSRSSNLPFEVSLMPMPVPMPMPMLMLIIGPLLFDGTHTVYVVERS